MLSPHASHPVERIVHLDVGLRASCVVLTTEEAEGPSTKYLMHFTKGYFYQISKGGHLRFWTFFEKFWTF